MTDNLRVIGAVARNRRLRALGIAFVGFNIGEYAVWIAMLVFAYDHGGATTAGIVAAVQLVPAAIFAPLAAALPDRYPPARVLAAGYLAQSLAMGATALALYADAAPALAYGLAAIAASAVTMTRPTQCTLVPALARKPEELTAANVVLGWVESAAILIGPALAGVLLGVGGTSLTFAVMAGIVLGSAVLAASIDGPRAPARRESLVEDVGDAADGVLAGFRALSAGSGARLLVALLGAQFIVIGALDVLFVVLALGALDLGQSGAGYLNAAFGLGGVLGVAATASLIGARPLLPPLLAGLGIWALGFFGIGFSSSAVLAFLLLALSGAGRSLFDVAGRTLLQRSAPQEVLGRVFGVLEGVSMGALAAGSLAASGLVALGGAKLAFIAMGALLPAIALTARGRLLRLDAEADVPIVQLSLLSSVPLTAALARPELERMARGLTPLDVAAGAHVCDKGEVGDRFYVIAEGDYDVFDGATQINSMSRGDAFGEIALLEDCARTATVVARGDGTLYALDRDDFLAAIMGNAGFGRDAAELVEARLENSRRREAEATA